MTWNKLGGFTSQQDVLAVLFTAAAKVGVMELNRPEDLEYNPKDPSGTPRIYVAFTNHDRQRRAHPARSDWGAARSRHPRHVDRPARRQGRLDLRPARRPTPATRRRRPTFKYFAVWRGSISPSDVYAAANPDNLVVDKDGDLWFGTDGNFGTQRDNPIPAWGGPTATPTTT